MATFLRVGSSWVPIKLQIDWSENPDDHLFPLRFPFKLS